MCGRAYRHSAQREMIQCSMCRKHVHSACDPEATEEKILERRAVQFNYMYVCKICKGQQAMKVVTTIITTMNNNNNEGPWSDGRQLHGGSLVPSL